MMHLASVPRAAVVACMAVLATLAGTSCTLLPGGSDDGPSTLTVVDYNILHGLYDEDPTTPDFDLFEERLTLLAAQLSKLKPDVVVLQEFVLRGPPGYPDVQVVLRDALGDQYTMIFGEASVPKPNEPSIGRMTLTRLPVVSSASRTVFQGRSAHRVTVQTKGGVIDIYNVHLEGPELVGQQELEITRLITFIDTAGRNQNPVIVTGDFNSRPGDAALRQVASFGFHDALAELQDVTCDKPGDPGCTRATKPVLVNSPQSRADIRIDYMYYRAGTEISLKPVAAIPFMNAPLQTEDHKLLWVSDHIGILTTFELAPRGPTIGPAPRN